MIQFHTYHKRLFKRYGFKWLQTAVFALCFIVLYNALMIPFRDDADAVRVQTASNQATIIAPQPNIMAERMVSSTRAPATAKPVVHEASFAEQISSNISSILEPGSRALVSAKKVMVGRGDTLMDLLVEKASVPREEAFDAVAALSKVYNPRDLTPGHEITVFFHKDPSVADPKFSGVRIEKDIINTVTVQKNEESGDFTVNKHEKGVERDLKAFKGTINSSLFVDAKAAGVPDAVILEIIKMYSWNVDFQREVQNGDKFEVMYEEYMTEDGKVVRGKGNIVYAKLTLDGDEMPYYRYEGKDGGADYYDDKGQSAKRTLMQTPIDGARLSSGFGMRRHPVLGYSKMHKGVDFAAPRGTPIYAAGDGVVEKAGPFSTYGNYVRIRHNNNIKTAYAHMKSFKPGLRAGSRVKQGEVIGYVGTTGRSTGPHLHYEVMVNNGQVNPKSMKLPTGKSLKGKDMKSFKTIVAQTQRKFDDINRSSVALTVASKDR